MSYASSLSACGLSLWILRFSVIHRLKHHWRRVKIWKWMSCLVDSEIFADIDNPGAQTSCCSRFGSDCFRCEVGLLQIVFLYLLHTRLRDIVLVEVEQHFEKRIHITHVLFACWPTHILHSTPAWHILRRPYCTRLCAAIQVQFPISMIYLFTMSNWDLSCCGNTVTVFDWVSSETASGRDTNRVLVTINTTLVSEEVEFCLSHSATQTAQDMK